jgi:hypothetical protein
MIAAGLIGYNVKAIRLLLVGDKSLKTVTTYWAQHNKFQKTQKHVETNFEYIYDYSDNQQNI